MTHRTQEDTLIRLERKLDRLLAGHRAVEELVDDGMHVAREATRAWSPLLVELDRKGWFTKGQAFLGVLDEIVEGYTEDDVRELARNVVTILDTVRSLTQPDVMAVAAEATEAVHHADDLAPVGPFGMLKATGDEDVQRGLAVVLDVMRRIGKATGARSGVSVAPARAAVPVAAAPVPRAPQPAPAAPAAAPAAPAAAPAKEGYDPDWSEARAAETAAALGLTLTDASWAVVRFMRAEYARSGVSPNVRRIAAGAGVSVKDLYALFPKGPGKLAARVAGVPKPAGCI